MELLSKNQKTGYSMDGIEGICPFMFGRHKKRNSLRFGLQTLSIEKAQALIGKIKFDCSCGIDCFSKNALNTYLSKGDAFLKIVDLANRYNEQLFEKELRKALSKKQSIDINKLLLRFFALNDFKGKRDLAMILFACAIAREYPTAKIYLISRTLGSKKNWKYLVQLIGIKPLHISLSTANIDIKSKRFNKLLNQVKIWKQSTKKSLWNVGINYTTHSLVQDENIPKLEKNNWIQVFHSELIHKLKNKTSQKSIDIVSKEKAIVNGKSCHKECLRCDACEITF